jgi:hypothetical protein
MEVLDIFSATRPASYNDAPKYNGNEIAGWLAKEASGFSLTSWSDRFFVYTKSDMTMKYYEDQQRTKLKGTFVVGSVVVQIANDAGEHRFTMKGMKEGVTEGTLFVKATSGHSLSAWVNFVELSLGESADLGFFVDETSMPQEYMHSEPRTGGVFQTHALAGWLAKEASGFSLTSWSDRFFVYTKSDTTMKYYEDQQRTKLKGTFVVGSVVVQIANDAGEYRFTMKGMKEGVTEGTLFVKATSGHSLSAWVSFIEESLARREVSPRKQASNGSIDGNSGSTGDKDLFGYDYQRISLHSMQQKAVPPTTIQSVTAAREQYQQAIFSSTQQGLPRTTQLSLASLRQQAVPRTTEQSLASVRQQAVPRTTEQSLASVRQQVAAIPPQKAHTAPVKFSPEFQQILNSNRKQRKMRFDPETGAPIGGAVNEKWKSGGAKFDPETGLPLDVIYCTSSLAVRSKGERGGNG